MKYKMYYTAKETLSILLDIDFASYSNYAFSTYVVNNLYNYIISDLSNNTDFYPFVDNQSITTNAKNVIQLTLRRFANNFAMILEYNLDDTKTISRARTWLEHFLDVLSFTYQKYNTILSFYESKKNQLLDPKSFNELTEASSSTNSKSRYNDTPQQFGDYDTDDYTTNAGYSKNDGSSNIETNREYDDKYNIEKLSLVEKYYNDVLLRWSNEFKILFFGDGEL